MGKVSASLTCIVTILCPAYLFAKDSKLKFEGRVKVGFESERFKDGEPEYDAKLRIKTKRKQNTRGVFVLRSDLEENSVFLQEAYLDRKFISDNKLQFGLFKKRLGIEWEDPERKRITVDRTLVYQKIEEFGYVGRETSIKYTNKKKDKQDYEFSASIGYAEANDFDSIFYISSPLFSSATNIGSWSLIQHDRIDNQRQFVWAQFLSLWAMYEESRWDFELFGGQDPFESEFQKQFGNGLNIYYYGAKASYGIAWLWADKEKLETFLASTYLVHDAESPAYNSIQAITGLNYYLDDLMFAFNIDVIGTNSRIEPERRTYDESEFTVEAKVYF